MYIIAQLFFANSILTSSFAQCYGLKYLLRLYIKILFLQSFFLLVQRNIASHILSNYIISRNSWMIPIFFIDITINYLFSKHLINVIWFCSFTERGIFSLWNISETKMKLYAAFLKITVSIVIYMRNYFAFKFIFGLENKLSVRSR